MRLEDLHELLKQGESQTMSPKELKFSTDLAGTKWGPGAKPLIEAGMVKMTVPDRPRSSRQKCRVTHKELHKDVAAQYLHGRGNS